ncbi:hypothetical protein BDF14DRAFT_1883042 [Spinellus fusiger]|nr:hypothetical protein BDF14DRAFT_1883042 [Spinellus fusiger]
MCNYPNQQQTLYRAPQRPFLYTNPRLRNTTEMLQTNPHNTHIVSDTTDSYDSASRSGQSSMDTSGASTPRNTIPNYGNINNGFH